MLDRVHRELTAEGIQKIATTYHAWRGDKGAGKYEDIAGFCKSAKLQQIRAHSFVLTPGRYVGAAHIEDDGQPFEHKMKRLGAELEGQFTESARLEKAIRASLNALTYD